MRGAAESETVAEETVPVLTQTTILALRNAISPEIAPACFAMPVVGVAPEPGIGGGSQGGSKGGSPPRPCSKSKVEMASSPGYHGWSVRICGSPTSAAGNDAARKRDRIRKFMIAK